MRKRMVCVFIILVLCFIVCVNQMQIFFLKSKIERLENYNFKGESIVFLGDSITSRYDVNKFFSNHNVINSGIGGNLTIDILNDLEARVFKYNPSKVFLLIGTNDIVYSDLGSEGIKRNIEEIVDKIYNQNFGTKIYLQSIYPINNNVNEEMVAGRTNEGIKDLNEKIKVICESNKCTYIDMFSELIDGNGNLKRVYTVDGIHLSKIGYVKVTKELLKYVGDES